MSEGMFSAVAAFVVLPALIRISVIENYQEIAWEHPVTEDNLPQHFQLGMQCNIQLTLVISTSLISNNRLSRSENVVPA